MIGRKMSREPCPTPPGELRNYSFEVLNAVYENNLLGLL